FPRIMCESAPEQANPTNNHAAPQAPIGTNVTNIDGIGTARTFDVATVTGDVGLRRLWGKAGLIPGALALRRPRPAVTIAILRDKSAKNEQPGDPRKESLRVKRRVHGDSPKVLRAETAQMMSFLSPLL